MFLSLPGLSVSESSKLCNYHHFRAAKLLDEKSLLQRASLDKAIDYMDSLEEDIPKGERIIHFLFSLNHEQCWMSQKSNNHITLKDVFFNY